MVLSLIGPVDLPHVQRALLVAAYAGIRLKVVPIRIGKENETEEYRLNCHPMQRVPVMKTDEGYLFETNAMIRYLARTEVMLAAAANSSADKTEAKDKIPHPQYPVPYAMYGHSLLESAQVDSWLDFAATRIDLYTKQFYAFECLEGPRPDTDAKKQLLKALDGIERRLTYLKGARHANVQPTGSLTERSIMTEEELVWNEENYMMSRATRDSRLSSVYNVADSIRQRHMEKERQERETQLETIKKTTNEALGEEEGSEDTRLTSRRQSMSRDGRYSTTPRASVLMSARGSARAPAPQRQDLVFLVGDSLTAADLVMAMSLHAALSCRELMMEITSKYRNTFDYYKNVLTLPVAAEVGKAIGLKVIQSVGEGRKR